MTLSTWVHEEDQFSPVVHAPQFENHFIKQNVRRNFEYLRHWTKKVNFVQIYLLRKPQINHTNH